MPRSLAAVALAPARTQVLRGVSEHGPWELWRREPPVQLRGLLLGLWAGLASDPAARHRVMPNGEVMLMLQLETPQRLTERDGLPESELLRGGFIAGLQERPATYECIARQTRVVAARLTPLGAWVLSRGLPQVELTRRVLALDDVLPKRTGVRELRERMLDETSLGVALDLLEHWLLQHCADAPPAHVATRAGLAMLRDGDAALPVSEIARQSGVSARRLHELCLRELGLPAKRLQRVLRFRRAVELLARRPERALHDLALACGYYDQSHLYRDFRELAGMTPVDYRVALGDAEDGPDVIAG